MERKLVMCRMMNMAMPMRMEMRMFCSVCSNSYGSDCFLS